MELIVAGDADFMRLREHPEYESSDPPTREVETETSIPPELRGSLHKNGTNAVVISEARAENIRCRLEEVESKIDAFFQCRGSGASAGEHQTDGA